jgi:hypothetical protein
MFRRWTTNILAIFFINELSVEDCENIHEMKLIKDNKKGTGSHPVSKKARLYEPSSSSGPPS